MNKKFYIRTFGCQANIRDSEFVSGILIADGFRLVDSPGEADVVIFNSCSVRKHAEDRLFGNIFELKDEKKKNPDLIVVLMGCTAQAYQEKALSKVPLIDIVCGTGNEADLPKLIKDFRRKRFSIIASDKIDKKRPELFPKYRQGRFKAQVMIGEGCNNYCSYCIVPYVRGIERSRNEKDIIKEIRDLSSRGFKEIMLLGQNVNSYGYSALYDPRFTYNGFIRLLEKVNKIRGVERIRFMTSHPKDAHKELFMAMRDLDKVCEHLHLPLQSGSDRILKLMNRKYTVKKYMKLAEDYKRIVTGGSITTDIIVGFPTETGNDFKDTCHVMNEIGFNASYAFKYSPRPPAKSALLTDDVSEAVKNARLNELMERQCKMSLGLNKEFIGRTVEALIESVAKKDSSYVSGRTRENVIAIAKGARTLIGEIVRIKVESVTPYVLCGKII